MNKGIVLTGSLLIAVVLILGLYDIYAEIALGNDATISMLLTTFGQRYPIIPFTVGVLVGHVWASQHDLPLPK